MHNNLFVLTGPPCSGKTTLLQELKKSGFSVVQEAQIHTIEIYKEKLGENGWKTFIRNSDGTINKPNFFRFMQDCLEYQMWQENIMQDSRQPVILDRSVIDCLSFFELRSIPNIRHTQFQVMKHLSDLGGYGGVFDLSILEDAFFKRAQEGRVITLQESEAFGQINRSLYRSAGYIPIEFLSRRTEQNDSRSVQECIHSILLQRKNA